MKVRELTAVEFSILLLHSRSGKMPELGFGSGWSLLYLDSQVGTHINPGFPWPGICSRFARISLRSLENRGGANIRPQAGETWKHQRSEGKKHLTGGPAFPGGPCHPARYKLLRKLTTACATPDGHTQALVDLSMCLPFLSWVLSNLVFFRKIAPLSFKKTIGWIETNPM